MFLAFDKKNGVKYAKWLRSVRADGTVRHEYVNIGLVLDEERHIFRNRRRGVFTFNPETGEYGPAPADFVPPPAGRRGPERLILDFGDAYVLDAFLAASGLSAALDAIGYANPDTLRAMLAHYVLCGMAACHAASWWEGSYARLLWPRADLRSQRISEFLAALGGEALQRRFFAAYLDAVRALVGAKGKGKGKGRDLGSLLIDSTGLPNSIRFPLTAVSNHNGKVSREVRLIYVLHRGRGLPLYFRCCPGNVVDVSTLGRTFAELDELGIAPEEAILDAGYYDLENLGELYGRGIAFVTRPGEHHALHKDLMAAHLGSVMRRGNLVRFNERYVYVKRVPCKPDGEHDGWAYLGLDPARRHDEEEKLLATHRDGDELHFNSSHEMITGIEAPEYCVIEAESIDADKGLIILGDELNAVANNVTIRTSYSNVNLMFTLTDENGKIVSSGNALNIAKNSFEQSSAVTSKINLPAELPQGSYNLTFNYYTTSANALNPIGTSDGKLVVVGHMAKFNEAFDIDDVTTVISYVLGESYKGTTIDIDDITALIGYILSGSL